jgi:hypothetical protein
VAVPGAPPPQPADLHGEWVTTGETGDLLALAWWAAHRGARSIQVRTNDPDMVARLPSGFTARARE